MNSTLDNFIKKLNDNEFVYGVFMKTSDPMFVEIAGYAGFDYVILDTEHGPTDIEHQQNNIRACEIRGLLPIVRVSGIDENIIGKAFDIGAAGIQVPQIKNEEDAKKVVEYAKFYPKGNRGVCRFVRAANYSAMDKKEYFTKANDNLIILQIEGIEAINNLDKILKVDGYDVIFIGPYDLSQSLGLTGEIKHPRVLSEMVSIVKKAKSYGKIVGTFTDDFEMVQKWKSLGVQCISHSTDVGLFYDCLKDVSNKLKLIGDRKCDVKVLDCTLRDGGYVNNWNFGQKGIKKIISDLISSKIEIIECGFLSNKVENQNGVSKYRTIEEVNKILPKKSDLDFAMMINYGEYDIDDIGCYYGYGINTIRVAFHKKDLNEALVLCEAIMKKGYKVFVQAMVTLSYTDSEFSYLIKKCNEFKPYSLYVVDSFGVMNKTQVLHYYKILERELDSDIYPGFHSHNNMQLAYCNAIELVENSTRPMIIDATIHGMGRGAGNLNTEIFVQYLNENYNASYNLQSILETNDLVVEKIYKKYSWGYSLPNYLSARHNCHPSYAKYLSEKNNLSYKDIDSIFMEMDIDKKNEFDREYIEKMYISYLESKTDNEPDDFERVKSIFYAKNVVMICPGKSSISKINELKENIDKDSVIVSINHDYPLIKTDYIFVGNNKRMLDINTNVYSKTIITSNIPNNGVFAKISYDRLLNDNDLVRDNTGLMFLKLLFLTSVNSVTIIGMDGYKYDSEQNYASNEMELVSMKETVDNLNLGIKIELQKFNNILKINHIK